MAKRPHRGQSGPMSRRQTLSQLAKHVLRRKNQTPARANRTQRQPATQAMLTDLLDELNIKTAGAVEFVLVSRWAAKHVWRLDLDGVPYAYVRYLLGAADQYPDRWRHLRLGELLHAIKVGPRVLGMTPASAALGGRAAIVELAQHPIERDALEARAVEALSLFTRLHGSDELRVALARDMTEQEIERMQPLQRLFDETRERWFEAVVGRWLSAGLDEITPLVSIVTGLVNQIEDYNCCPQKEGMLVPAHNDPNHGNFMLNRQGALRMIDFEELALNNPVADLGVFLTWYVDRDQHRDLLTHYPLAEPDDMLDWMQVWVPLRYLNIAAHWAARLTRARDEDDYFFALESVDEWLRGTAELVNDGPVPDDVDVALLRVMAALEDRMALIVAADG